MVEFTTKDSGQRREFASGMVRDTNEGKTLWHLVTRGPLLRRWAELLTRGAVKYSADNWMQAAGQEELDRFKESAFRHFMQWFNGERDEDHAAAVTFNINGAEYVQEKLEAQESETFTDSHGLTWDTFHDDGLVPTQCETDEAFDHGSLWPDVPADPSYVQDSLMHTNPPAKDDFTGSFTVQRHPLSGFGPDDHSLPHYHEEDGTLVLVEV